MYAWGVEILLAQYPQKVWHPQNRESLTKVDSGLDFGYISVKAGAMFLQWFCWTN